MTGSLKKLFAALLAAALAAALCACTKSMDEHVPNGSPAASETAEAGRSAGPTPEASEQQTAPAEASASPEASETAEGSEPAGGLEGFMEGEIVDPDSVPELIAMLAERADYKDMAVQSITYKLYEGRQAYYVVLQGEGEAAHPVYVFADESIIDDTTGE
ncbi:MAG: hypothetical protein IKG85_06535 [Clostridia bacterium]|nr:hypothetical protein [Clostridia bacterium]